MKHNPCLRFAVSFHRSYFSTNELLLKIQNAFCIRSKKTIFSDMVVWIKTCFVCKNINMTVTVNQPWNIWMKLNTWICPFSPINFDMFNSNNSKWIFILPNNSRTIYTTCCKLSIYYIYTSLYHINHFGEMRSEISLCPLSNLRIMLICKCDDSGNCICT